MDCATNISNSIRAKALQDLSGKGIEIFSPLNKEVDTNVIGRFNGITSQKLHDVQGYLNSLDNALTRNTSIEDWIENDHLIFPAKKYVEAFVNTDSNYILSEDYYKDNIATPLINEHQYLNENERIVSEIAKIMSENGLAERTHFFTKEEYNKKQKELTGKTFDSDGFVFNRTIYYNQEKITPKTLIHENAHIWYSIAKQTNPNLIKSAAKHIIKTKYYTEVKEKYKDIYTTEEQFIEEAIVTMLGENLLDDYLNENNANSETHSIWYQIWNAIKNIIEIFTGKNYTLAEIQQIAYKDIFSQSEMIETKTPINKEAMFIIRNKDVKSDMKQILTEGLNSHSVKTLIQSIKKNISYPETFVDYEKLILNYLLKKRRDTLKYSKDVLHNKDEIIKNINEQIFLHYNNLEKASKGEINWQDMLTSQIDFMQEMFLNLKKEDADYGFFLFQLKKMTEMFIDNSSTILLDGGQLNVHAKNKLENINHNIKKSLEILMVNDIAKQREERKKYRGEENINLSKDEMDVLGNSVSEMFSTKKDINVLNYFLGIKQGLKGTNEELGEYIINEYMSNKNKFLGETSKLIAELESLERSLGNNKDKLKKLFVKWEEKGIIHHEQQLISPYLTTVFIQLNKLDELKSKILSGINVKENTKEYHRIVNKYFDISVNYNNIEEHRLKIEYRLGQAEYKKIKNLVDRKYNEWLSNDNKYYTLIDKETNETNYILKDNIEQDIIEDAEVNSLFLFEVLIPKYEYVSEAFDEIRGDAVLYSMWILIDNILTSFHNPVISSYDKKYGSYNNQLDLAQRRIPILASIYDTQIEQYSQNRKFWKLIGSFFHKLVGSILTPKEREGVKERIKGNVRTGSFTDSYYNKYNKLYDEYKKNKNFYDLLEIAEKLKIINEDAIDELNNNDYEYLLDAVIKAEIASKHKYNVVDILKAINIPLADAYAGNQIWSRMQYLIGMFGENTNKHKMLLNWYNQTILGETGVDNWQMQRLSFNFLKAIPIVNQIPYIKEKDLSVQFNSKAFREWKKEIKQLVKDNRESEIDMSNNRYGVSYKNFILRGETLKFKVETKQNASNEPITKYFYGETEINKDKYNKAFLKFLDDNDLDTNPLYITPASILTEYLLIKVVRDLGLSVPAMITNRRAGRLSNEQTAMSGRYYDMMELMNSRSFLFGSIPSQIFSTIVTFGNMEKFLLVPSSHRRNQIRLFEKFVNYNNLIMQKDLFQYEDGNRISSFLMNFAIDVPEFSNQGEVLLAMLSRLEYDKRDENGQVVIGRDGKPEKVKFFNSQTGEFELLDPNSGSLKLKKGYESLEEEIMKRKGGKFNQLLIDYRYVNQMNQGNYSKDDTPLMFSYPIGKVAFTYMRWVPEGIYRMYKGIYSRKELDGRLNALTGEVERRGVLSTLAKYPHLNMTFHQLGFLVSGGPIAAIGLTVGLNPVAVLAIGMLGAYIKATVLKQIAKKSMLTDALKILDEEEMSARHQLKQTISFSINLLIRVLVAMIPGNNPMSNKIKGVVNSGADVKMGWSESTVDGSYADASSLYMDMQQLEEANYLLATEIRKFLFITLMQTVGVATLVALLSALGIGGDDDDDKEEKLLPKLEADEIMEDDFNISLEIDGELIDISQLDLSEYESPTPIDRNKKSVNKIKKEKKYKVEERRLIVAEGIANRIVNMSTQGYDINQFAFSLNQTLGYFMPGGNPNSRSITMMYSNLVTGIQMLSGVMGYTPARAEKVAVYANPLIAFPSKITHMIVDLLYISQKNSISIQDNIIDLIETKRTSFTDTKIYSDGQLLVRELFNKDNINDRFEKKWNVFWNKQKKDMFEIYLSEKYDRTISKKEQEEEREKFEAKFNRRKNYIQNQSAFRNEDLKKITDFTRLYEQYEHEMKIRASAGDYEYFLMETKIDPDIYKAEQLIKIYNKQKEEEEKSKNPPKKKKNFFETTLETISGWLSPKSTPENQ